MAVEADLVSIREFLAKKEGEIRPVPVYGENGRIILHYQLIWELLGNVPEEDQRIVVGSEYPTVEDAIADIEKAKSEMVQSNETSS